MEKEKQFGGKLADIGQFCFYAGLVLELLIVIIDKSAYINPVEGQLFRITFILFLIKVCCTKFSLKEWLWLLVFLLLAGSCYMFSGRDEAVRLVVFCAAFKNIDFKKIVEIYLLDHIIRLYFTCGIGGNRNIWKHVYC